MSSSSASDGSAYDENHVQQTQNVQHESSNAAPYYDHHQSQHQPHYHERGEAISHSNINDAVILSDEQHQIDTPLLASANTLTTAAAAASAINQPASTESVVPDLMQVYERMTQSKTPHNPMEFYPHLQQRTDNRSHPNANYNQQSQSATHAAPSDLQERSNNTASNYYNYGEMDHGSPQPINWSSHQDDATVESVSIPPPFPLPTITDEQQQKRQKKSHEDTGVDDDQQQQSRSLRKRKEVSSGYSSSTSSRGGSKSRRTKTSSKISGGGEGGGGSGIGGKGKGGKPNDGRWSKRFTWPEELHRDFVSAIFDVGLKHSSPNAVMEHMPTHEEITTERIKSHLQKYRLHRAKSKKEFMSSYSASLKKFNAEGTKETKALGSGQVAAHLTHATLNQPDPEQPIQSHDIDLNPATKRKRPLSKITSTGQTEKSKEQQVFIIPRLTENERQSPIGMAMGYLLGLFFSLKNQLEQQRQEAAAAAAHRQQQATVAVYDSFVSESPKRTAPISGSPPSIGGLPTTAAAAPTAQKWHSRSNLEESTKMKREMETQRAVQNKMRALKQQELNKYKMVGVPQSVVPREHHQQQRRYQHQELQEVPQQQQQFQPHHHNNKDLAIDHSLQQDQQAPNYQVAGEDGASGSGESGGGGGGGNTAARDRNMSFGEEGTDDDIWNASVVDEDLFNFLMNS